MGGGQTPRAPLPLDPQGKVDLDRLELPPGVSITKLNGPVPERRYFPSKPNGPGEEQLPLPGQHQSHAWNQPWMAGQQPALTPQQQPLPAAANPNAEYLLKVRCFEKQNLQVKKSCS